MILSRSLTALAVLLLLGVALGAEEAVLDNCTVVKAGDRQLTFTDGGGKEHTVPVASDARISVDGKEAKLAGLKPGLKIRLTGRKADGKPEIVRIEGSTR